MRGLEADNESVKGKPEEAELTEQRRENLEWIYTN